MKPSTWVTKLSELAWVPCNDGQLRRPKEVLGAHDGTRADAPFSILSPELVATLEGEGVSFGTEVPSATTLTRLSATGSTLGAHDLAQLLVECRELSSDDERLQLAGILRTLTFPIGSARRVPLDRIAQRIGGRRGALGGWIVALDQIDDVLRRELEHGDFPYDFPETTSGEQALAFLNDTWDRASSSPDGLANEVRDILPTAYAYCLDDCEKDASLAQRWSDEVPSAAVFAGGEWVVLRETDGVYFDDIDDRRFLPRGLSLPTATTGHLGNTLDTQSRTADALGLTRLSSSITIQWHGEEATLPVPPRWIDAFDLVCRLLRSVRANGDEADVDEEIDASAELYLAHVQELAIDVSADGQPPERVPVNARLNENYLMIAGRPVEFSADAAKELLRHFSFRQRGDLAADLAGMLGAVDDSGDFYLAADKFRRAFVPHFDISRLQPANESAAAHATASTRGDDDVPQRPGADMVDRRPRGPVEVERKEIRVREAVRTADHTQDAGSERLQERNSTFTKGRALAASEYFANGLIGSLKGEIVPSSDDVDPIARTRATEGIGDEEYREAAMQYERKFGREPALGTPQQEGWDVRSKDVDAREIRLIEVKGKGSPWVDDEVVELSRAQVRKALVTADQSEVTGRSREVWYLYVVEKAGDSYKVLPIRNPAETTTKWMLCGGAWRALAESASQSDESAWRERVKVDLAAQVRGGGELYGYRQDGAYVVRTRSGDQIVTPGPASK